MEKVCSDAKNTENNFIDANEVVGTDREEMPRKYYKTRAEAEEKRRRGERIYYKPEYGYYIVRPRRRNWWDIF